MPSGTLYSGYGCEDMFLSPHIWRTSWEMLQRIVPETDGMMVAIGLPLYVTNGVYNVACVAANGRIAGFVPKQHLAGDGLHYEPRWFRAWPAETITEYRVGEEAWPIGDLLFEVDGVRAGFEICEDAWVAGRPGIEWPNAVLMSSSIPVPAISPLANTKSENDLFWKDLGLLASATSTPI